MGDPIKIGKYVLPADIVVGSPLAVWLSGKSEPELAAMDRGDPETLPSEQNLLHTAFEKAHDAQLGKVELFQGITAEYEQNLYESVQAGLSDDWVTWEYLLEQKDGLAAMVGELGWEPAFHIGNREYQRRIATELRANNVDLASGGQIFTKAPLQWAAGGLCLEYPEGTNRNVIAQSAETTVTACLQHDLLQWGTCTDTSRKMAAVTLGWLAVSPKEDVDLRWVDIDNISQDALHTLGWNNNSAAHSFVALYRPGVSPLALDPSRVGFTLEQSATYCVQELWRGSTAVYYRNRAGVFLRQGMLAEAETSYRQAILLDPKAAVPYISLGTIMEILGKVNEAETMYRQAIAVNPQDIYAYSNLANILYEQGRYGAAETMVQQAIALDSKYSDAHTIRGLLLIAQQRFDAAVIALRLAIQNDSKNITAYLSLGTVLNMQGDYQAAETVFRQSIAIDSKNALAYFNLGVTLVNQKKFRDAMIAWRQSLALQPDAPNVRANIDQLLSEHPEAAD